jgi:succinoglycan biosynthesis transport protein ExoP
MGLVSMHQPGSRFADAIRAVRLACTMSHHNGVPKVILMSSTMPGEGKSTIAANLARSLARTGATTLLIDADSRDATLTRLFAQPGMPGLSEVLGGKASLKSASLFEEESGLFFLSNGQERLDLEESDLLAGDRLSEFLNHYRKGFDHIVIDAPPVLSMADGRVLYRYVDAAIYVVEWGKTSADMVMAGLSALGGMRSKIVGTVLNKTDPSHSEIYG